MVRPSVYSIIDTRWKSAAFQMGQSLNPYLLYYAGAFAFSNILCLLRIVHFLRFAYLFLVGAHKVYLVSLFK